MNPEELWETTLNPENRTLIRLTTSDLEKERSTFALLHSGKSDKVSERKEMMSKFKISLDDLDN